MIQHAENIIKSMKYIASHIPHREGETIYFLSCSSAFFVISNLLRDESNCENLSVHQPTNPSVRLHCIKSAQIALSHSESWEATTPISHESGNGVKAFL
jgi:hypothetical protein